MHSLVNLCASGLRSYARPGCIEGLLRYFNQYAFTQVAIYGKSYCNAGRVCRVCPFAQK